MSTAIAQGFADHPVDSAVAFRQILDAFANPGQVVDVPPAVSPVGKLNRTAAAVALTLLDHETPIWFDAQLDCREVRNFVAFHCSAPYTAAGEAAFAFFDGLPDEDAFDGLSTGTVEYPDRSATAIVQTRELYGDLGLKLTGPGIKESRRFGFAGLTPTFTDWLLHNRARFPLGIDFIFAAPEQLAALPRSVHAEWGTPCM